MRESYSLSTAEADAEQVEIRIAPEVSSLSAIRIFAAACTAPFLPASSCRREECLADAAGLSAASYCVSGAKWALVCFGAERNNKFSLCDLENQVSAGEK